MVILNFRPQDVHILISRLYECVTLYGKRDFEDAIKKLEIRKLSLDLDLELEKLLLK